jgi:LmbE family N-acetylglucosaminyl deacetylase
MLALLFMTLTTTSRIASPAMSPSPPAPIQAPSSPTLHAGELALAIESLGSLGSVLYVAAHPDDENTRLLAYLAGRGMRTAYLSLTRGDGGQNLIGVEQDTALGLLRTHELLAARAIDGAEQLFTRARDFGYSKSAAETLDTWGREETLADVVLAIRRFRPDVVVTRFSTDPPNHGHHTASSLLAAEAFHAAADRARFPEQLSGTGLEPWQADRLLYNVAPWALKPDADLSRYLALDVGSYSPQLGASWGEIAARSRSQHKSQGFGVGSDRGPHLEHFQTLARKGKAPPPKRDIFEGIPLGWSRVKGGEAVEAAVRQAADAFRARAPHESIPALLRVRAALLALPAAGDPEPTTTRHLRDHKLRRLDELLVACAGLFLEARSSEGAVAQGGELPLELTALVRAPLPAKPTTHAAGAPRLEHVGVRAATPGLSGGALGDALGELRPAATLTPHAPWRSKLAVTVPPAAAITTPYWLESPPASGRFTVEPGRANDPVSPAPLAARFRVVFPVAGATDVGIDVERPVAHVWVDPVRGELSRDVEIVPPATATFEHEVLLFTNGEPREVSLVLAASHAAGAAGALRLELPAGYRAAPEEISFALGAREQRTVSFRVTPPAPSKRAAAPSGERTRVAALIDGRPAHGARTIQHEHVPPLTVRAPAEAALVPLSLKKGGRRIGYIPGPGDRVAESLEAVGYEVTALPESKLAAATAAELQGFDAIIVGVRAYNSEPRLALAKDKLLTYVERGGRLVVQYMTNSRVGPLVTGIWPFPLELGRERVTDQTAAVTRLVPGDPIFSTPNAITPADFDGWVQERGLYFATSWDPRYTPLLSMNDPGEKPLEGALLVARHGKGTFIYTGLSFFRQLPAGVPGAYRLFANVIAR